MARMVPDRIQHELLLKGDKQNIINLLRNIYNYFFL